MKTYQVTRKFQITIPKILARELGIRPGDSVVIEKAGGAVVVKKAAAQVRDYPELKETVEALARDMEKIHKYVRSAERAVAENLSRHIGSK